MSFLCPVCGYPNLDENPLDLSSFEICPSCGFEFGVSDRDKGFSFNQWRNNWIKNGMHWSGSKTPPPNWSPQKQLLNVS